MQVAGLLLAAFAFCFCFFAFLANSLNPFATPRRGSSRHRRVKYFRYMAIALFLGVSLAVLLYHYVSQPILIAATAGAALFTGIILLPSIRYYDIALPFIPASKKSQLKTRNSTTHTQNQATHKARIASQNKQSNIGKPITNPRTQALATTTTNTEIEVKLRQRTSDGEYASKMQKIAKSAAHINNELTNLDQPINKAAIEVSHSDNMMDIDLDAPNTNVAARGR